MRGIFLTPPSAAAELGLNANTVRRWIYDGLLPASKTPAGHYLILRTDLETFVASLKVTTP